MTSFAAMTWAVIASLVETCKLNGVEPHAYLSDVLTRIAKGHGYAAGFSGARARCMEPFPMTSFAAMTFMRKRRLLAGRDLQAERGGAARLPERRAHSHRQGPSQPPPRRASGRIARSTTFESSSTRPSSRNTLSPAQRDSA
jgi:hypothetical protein